MKIAVISDIHGNMEALDAVMEDIKNQQCEKIFVLGDYAMAGPDPKSAVDYFMEQAYNSDYEMIQGNTDLMIVDFNLDLYDALKGKAPVMAEALKDDAKQLDASEKQFLQNLPIQKEVELEGVKFLLVHGSPRRNNEDILAETPMKKVEEMLADVDAQVVLCGHTQPGYRPADIHALLRQDTYFKGRSSQGQGCILPLCPYAGGYASGHTDILLSFFQEYNR